MPTTTPRQLADSLAKVLNDETRRWVDDRRSGSTVVHVDDSTTWPRPPAPAWYEPNTGDVHIHLDAANITDVWRATTSDDTKDGAVVRGLLHHELSHARHSAWLAKVWDARIDPVVLGILTMFEEMRVEARVVNSKEEHRRFLRAALPLAMGDAKENPPTTKFDVANAWGLIYGRALTTVITQDELRWMDDAARTVLGDDDVDYLGDLLQDAIHTTASTDHGRAHMIELAEEWLATVGRPPKAPAIGGCAHGKGEPEKDGDAAASARIKSTEKSKEDDEDGEGAGDGDDDDEEDGGGEEEIADGDPGYGDFNAEDDRKSKSDPTALSKDDVDMVSQMLAKTVDEVDHNWSRKGRIPMADPVALAKAVFDTSSVSWTATDPTPEHMNHVIKTAKVLEELVVPSISKVHVSSDLPPGRLKTREAVRASAERAQGRMMTARPWEGTKRRHTSTRPIVIGIATDISGSMKWAQSAVADFAFTWANAGRRVGARTAAVTFGESAQAIVRPGEVIGRVRRRAANGMNEHADHALAALDGVLKLSYNNGAAKLLVIVSDGHLVIGGEMQRVEQRLEDFKAAGTTVVWITPDNAHVRPLAKRGLVECVEVRVDTINDNPDAFRAIQKAVLSRLAGLAKKN